ncbi:LPXTG cell wall anchor domain-containing protein [Faecalimonas umbilicata]|uniref:LPXTG cell wall anchor domain-containing protein n=1 Tax=Faecalimonas umbilicata TaxID=1912855 RepID=UPI0022DEFB8B|nr:LPXTG cell wall anchor domain-containing protein [Faecalimonas umbilicata]
MRKKLVVALVAAMSLTVAGTGTVFAMNNFHMHGENCEWVVDKEAYDEIVKHPEEGHYETQKVLVKDAWDETVHHEAIYEDKEVWVVDKEAWDEEVRNPAKDVYELHYFCNGCQKDFGSDANGGYDAVMAHNREQMLAGNTACGGWHDGQVLVEEGYDIIHHPEEGHYETQKVLVKEAWDEIVHHEAVYEDKQVWVVDKEAWEETIHHPEEGHWVCNGEPQEPEQKPENPDQKPEQPENPEQKPEQPENPDQKPEQPENPDQKPEQPENPDQKPEQPENPDVETPETPDAENPETPEQKPEANKENVQTQETETKKEGTSPKTGDTTSALPVAGAGLASLGAVLATLLKKRK